MFLYYLYHYFGKNRKWLNIAHNVFDKYIAISASIVIFGTLVLQVYYEPKLIVAFIHNLPIIIKIFLIYLWWIVVVVAILAIVSLFFIPPFARNRTKQNIITEIFINRWRFIVLMLGMLVFGFLAFVMFGVLLKMFAFGIAIFLCLLLVTLQYVATKSIALGENGVIIRQICGEIFIPYSNLYPLSERELQKAIEDKMISIKYGDYAGVRFEVGKDKNTREQFMNLYNKKVMDSRKMTTNP
ncbi:hypothetical protein ACWIUD_09210 [Helicobacter sp. 23-1044]